MKRQIRAGWVLAALISCAVAPAAAELTVEADLGIEVASAYVWRGQVRTDRPVLFPDVRLDTSTGLWFDTWGALDLTSENGSDYDGQFEEVDLTIGYSLPLGSDAPVSVDLGLVQYLFPVGGGKTRELFLNLGSVLPLTDQLALAPHGSLYWDVDETGGDALYGLVAVDLLYAVTEMLSASAGVSLGIANGAYNRFYFGPDPGDEATPPEQVAASRAVDRDLDAIKVNDLSFSANVEYAVSQWIAIGLNGSYGLLPDDDISDAAKLAFDDDDIWHAGAYVTAHFD